MCTQAELNRVLEIFAKKMKDLYGEKLVKILLYGSYARKEQDEESDIDLMIIVNLSEEENRKYVDSLIEIVSEINLEYDVVLSPIVEPYQKYMDYKEVIPFLSVVDKEGIPIGV
jgi:predicted nucleotidyltransferase